RGIIPITAKRDPAGRIPRNMTDAAGVLWVMQGVDPADSATGAAAACVGRNYLDDLNPRALQGERIGVWRGGGDVADVNAVTDATITTLRAQGATVVDKIVLPGLDDAFNNELPALLVEFKHDINAYLAATPGQQPGDLAGPVAVNIQN